MNIVRRKVSLNKKRFEKEGFNLDLAYITPNVIAMGFPAVGMEAFYRNPRGEVLRFFNKKHKSAYKVYNMCSEPRRQYDAAEFEHRVARFPFADHQAPPLEMIGRCCADIERWLSSSENNVAAIHCKAGKGRAGMMICCYLLHSRFRPNADEAMNYYAEMRTWDREGVTIPSQRRYVRYYDDVVHFGMPAQPAITLTHITIQTSRYIDPAHAEPWVEVLFRGYEPLYVSKPQKPQPNKDLTIEIPHGGVEVKGDIKVIFFDKAINEKKEMFHCWFNTGFIENNQLILQKPEIDVAWKDKGKKFHKDFQIHFTFKGAEVAPMTLLKQQQETTSSKKKGKKKDRKTLDIEAEETNGKGKEKAEERNSESENESGKENSKEEKQPEEPPKVEEVKKKEKKSKKNKAKDGEKDVEPATRKVDEYSVPEKEDQKLDDEKPEKATTEEQKTTEAPDTTEVKKKSKKSRKSKSRTSEIN